jgi:hypothetical protein
VRFPFMLRSTHQFFMDSMIINLKGREDLIVALRQQLAEKNKHIDALQDMLTNPKCNDYTSEGAKKEKIRHEPIAMGRGGWRGQAERASNLTVPKPKDSVQALEQRVAEQGGKVDAV